MFKACSVLNYGIIFSCLGLSQSGCLVQAGLRHKIYPLQPPQCRNCIHMAPWWFISTPLWMEFIAQLIEALCEKIPNRVSFHRSLDSGWVKMALKCRGYEEPTKPSESQQQTGAHSSLNWGNAGLWAIAWKSTTKRRRVACVISKHWCWGEP